MIPNCPVNYNFALIIKEDELLVRSDNVYGEKTQLDLLDYFENESKKITSAHEKADDYVQGQGILSPVPVNKEDAGKSII